MKPTAITLVVVLAIAAAAFGGYALLDGVRRETSGTACDRRISE